jgi:hypothetical protein
MALRSTHILSALLVATATAAGHAAELGDARVLSHIGQALVADVELTLLEDPGTQVTVRLANPDVYRGANIAMPPVLSSLNMRVTRRDGRQFLHLTSLKPVESRHLHVYLELVDGGQRSVRLVTLWLTPDPNPTPAPAPVLLPVREPVAAAAVTPAQRPAAALHAGEEYVEESGSPVPRKAMPKPAPRPAPKPVQPRKTVPDPVPALKVPGDAPSCTQQAPSAELNACAALGEKNAALHHQLGQLEEKVKVLQAGTAGAAAPAAPPSVPAPAAKETPQDASKGAPRIQRKPKKAEPPEAETPWLLIGAGVAALAAIVGLVLALLARRKRSRIGKIAAEYKPARLPEAAPAGDEPKPNFMASVKSRLMPGRRKEAAPAEPVAQQVE